VALQKRARGRAGGRCVKVALEEACLAVQRSSAKAAARGGCCCTPWQRVSGGGALKLKEEAVHTSVLESLSSVRSSLWSSAELTRSTPQRRHSGTQQRHAALRRRLRVHVQRGVHLDTSTAGLNAAPDVPQLALAWCAASAAFSVSGSEAAAVFVRQGNPAVLDRCLQNLQLAGLYRALDGTAA